MVTSLVAANRTYTDYWKHEIRNQDDLNIHVNLLQHGYAQRPHSSFHRYVR